MTERKVRHLLRHGMSHIPVEALVEYFAALLDGIQKRDRLDAGKLESLIGTALVCIMTLMTAEGPLTKAFMAGPIDA